MKSKKNLVLIGMMSSGKSTIGELLAKKLNFKFFDIDKIIENETRMKITEIFKIKGENFFRKLEEKMTLKILKKNSSVISLGGGAFLNENIKREVLKNHISFWLNWDPKTLVDRIKNSTKRPVAFKSSKKELNELINNRSNFYSKALYKINCERLTKNEIVNKILAICENN